VEVLSSASTSVKSCDPLAEQAPIDAPIAPTINAFTVMLRMLLLLCDVN